MMLSLYLTPNNLADWLMHRPDYDMAFLMGRELSRVQDTQFMDCLAELLTSALLQVEDGNVPDWGNVTHFLAGILDGNGHRIVKTWLPE